MWTRAEIKSRAKEALKKYYWYAVLMCFIAGILGGGGSSSFSTSFRTGAQDYSSGQYGYGYSAQTIPSRLLGILMVMGVIFLIIWIFALVFSIFVGNPVQVGLKRYMLESREIGGSAGIAKLFWVFSSGHYLNIVKIMFLKGLYTTLWGLLFVIPGIIKSYEYSMIPYLLAENPEMDSQEAFRISREMTMNEKASIWVLDLSFLGWELLGVLACGIGILFVTPYIEATYVELYLLLRDKTDGLPYREFGRSKSYTTYDSEYDTYEI